MNFWEWRLKWGTMGIACKQIYIDVCFTQVLEPSFRQAYQNTNRWFTTIVNQPQVKSVIGEFKFCEKMAQFDGMLSWLNELLLNYIKKILSKTKYDA